MLWLFLDGTLLWVFLIIVSLGLFGTVQSDKPGWCSFIIGATILGLQFFSPYHPLSYALHDPINTALFVAGYAFAGTIWCVIKWMSYVHLLKDKYLDYKQEYLAANPQKLRDEYIAQYIMENPIQKYMENVMFSPNQQQLDLQRSRAADYADTQLGKADKYATVALGVTLPKTDAERSIFLRERKSLIYMWITFWPFSFIGTLFDDPVRRFLRLVYSSLTGILSSITEKAFKNI